MQAITIRPFRSISAGVDQHGIVSLLLRSKRDTVGDHCLKVTDKVKKENLDWMKRLESGYGRRLGVEEKKV